jgi:hypothetical protein
MEEKDAHKDCVVTELSKTEVIFKDTEGPDGGFLRYYNGKKDTLEFSYHDANGLMKFSLVFKKSR